MTVHPSSRWHKTTSRQNFQIFMGRTHTTMSLQWQYTTHFSKNFKSKLLINSFPIIYFYIRLGRRHMSTNRHTSDLYDNDQIAFCIVFDLTSFHERLSRLSAIQWPALYHYVTQLARIIRSYIRNDSKLWHPCGTRNDLCSAPLLATHNLVRR